MEWHRRRFSSAGEKLGSRVLVTGIARETNFTECVPRRTIRLGDGDPALADFLRPLLGLAEPSTCLSHGFFPHSSRTGLSPPFPHRYPSRSVALSIRLADRQRVTLSPHYRLGPPTAPVWRTHNRCTPRMEPAGHRYKCVSSPP